MRRPAERTPPAGGGPFPVFPPVAATTGPPRRRPRKARVMAIAHGTPDRVRWHHIVGPALTMVALVLSGTAAHMNQNQALVVASALAFLVTAVIQVLLLVRMYRQRRDDSARPPA